MAGAIREWPQAVLSGTIVPPTGSSSSPPPSLFFILGFRPEQVPTVLKAAEAGVLPTLPSSQWACLRGGPKTQAFLSSRPHPPAVLAVPVERGKALAVPSLDLLPSVWGTKDSGLRPQSSGLWLPEFRDLTSVAVMRVGGPKGNTFRQLPQICQPWSQPSSEIRHLHE